MMKVVLRRCWGAAVRVQGWLVLPFATALLLVVFAGGSAAAPLGTFAEFAVPTENAQPNGIAVGPDGNLWFTEFNADKIGRITPDGTITEFLVPTAGSDPYGIVAGPDGNIWFTELNGDQIGRLTPSLASPGTSNGITEFPITSDFAEPDWITAGPDGNLWFTEYVVGKIGRITPAGTITEFPLPDHGSGPAGIAAGPDGNLWFTEWAVGSIGRITPSGAVTEFSVPTASSNPAGIAAGPDGNLWFAESSGDKVARLTPSQVSAGTSNGITEFPLPTASGNPYGIAAGPNGNLWFSEYGGDKIGRLTPSGSFAEFTVPTGSSQPLGITAGPDGNLWFTEYSGNNIGRIAAGAPPAAITGQASSVSATSAILNGSVNPNDDAVSDCHFDWGVTSAYGNTIPCSSAPGSGSSDVPVSAALSGLVPGATYHFRVVATNGSGTSDGQDAMFTTGQASPSGTPLVVTGQASSLTTISATLNGTVNPNGQTVSDCHFDYGKTSDYELGRISCSALPGSGTSEVAVSVALSGLTKDSTYHFRVVASNAAGTSYGADESFTTPGCQSEVKFGVVDAVGGCFNLVPAGAHTAYASPGPFKLNGIQLYPLQGSTIILDQHDKTIHSDGGVAASVDILGASVPFELWQGPVEWTGLGGDKNGRAQLTDVPADTSSQLGGLSLAGTVEPTLIKGGSALIGVYVQLPKILSGYGGSVTFKTDNEHGAQLDGVSLSVPDASLGGVLPLTNLDVSYERATDTWSGSVGIKLGIYTVKGDIKFVHGQFKSAGAKWSGLNIAISTPPVVFLDSASLAVETHPFSLAGGVGITLGPGLGTNPVNGGSVALMGLEGTVKIVFSGKRGKWPPADLALDGVLSILSYKAATAHVDYRFGGTVTLGLNLRLPWWDNGHQPPAVRIAGGVNGWFQIHKMRFNAEGTVAACFFGCASADGLLSNLGAAACVSFFGEEIGGAYTFSDHKIHFPIGCDLSAYRTTQASDARLASGGRVIALPRGLRVAALRIQGSTGPPIVTITGPRGERIATPATGSGAKTSSYWLVKNPADNTTGVVIAHPTGGLWQITPAPGSPAITAVQDAYGLPPVSVHAHVTGNGRRFKLTYQIRPIPGQVVRFAERFGHTGYEIGTAQGARGTLGFTPGPGPAGRRSIIAIVLQNGLARRQLTIASYRAPALLKPGKPRHIKLRRRGTSLILSWSPTAGTASYEILAKLPRHRTELFDLPARQHTLLIPDVLAGDAGTIMITAIDQTGVRGPSATLTFKPPQRRAG